MPGWPTACPTWSTSAMIDESPAEDTFQAGHARQLDALLGLAEATDCRRVRLLAYFGEQYGLGAPGEDAETDLEGRPRSAWQDRLRQLRQLHGAPALWDGTDAARKLLSTIYRVHEASQLTFGAGHIMDVLRGKDTEEGAPVRPRQDLHLRPRQGLQRAPAARRDAPAAATGALGLHKITNENSGHSFDAVPGRWLARRCCAATSPCSCAAVAAPRRAPPSATQPNAAAAGLGPDAQVRFTRPGAPRSRARHNLPAYVIFHDATLAAIAEHNPASLDDLQGISGMGAKLYGAEVLQVVATG
ncbi:Bloom syndrome protein [Manis javanica]|nr:Bloom syndrome protein [Manis javanica]